MTAHMASPMQPSHGASLSSRAASIHFDVFTLFPEMFHGPLDESILSRAREDGTLSVALHDIRHYAEDKHHVTDEPPYGGGGGMVMKAEPIFNAVEAVLGRSQDEPVMVDNALPVDDALRNEAAGIQVPSNEVPRNGVPRNEVPIILLTPQGRLFSQEIAQQLSTCPRVALICGRYEGVDERVREHLVTDELSIGDYVLTGGELPALVIIDAVTRLLPGVLGDPTATVEDSHARGLLEGPHYTRPRVFHGWEVPDVLLSGDHAAVARWRREQALRRTLERRPELLTDADLSERDRKVLRQLREERKENGKTAPR